MADPQTPISIRHIAFLKNIANAATILLNQRDALRMLAEQDAALGLGATLDAATLPSSSLDGITSADVAAAFAAAAAIEGVLVKDGVPTPALQALLRFRGL